jgi:hypothetical protein
MKNNDTWKQLGNLIQGEQKKQKMLKKDNW